LKTGGNIAIFSKFDLGATLEYPKVMIIDFNSLKKKKLINF